MGGKPLVKNNILSTPDRDSNSDLPLTGNQSYCESDTLDHPIIESDFMVKCVLTHTVGTWKEGKILIFDDSFEHEVWHNGSTMRLVLIIDVWHPELTDQEKKSLPDI
uniref:Aspartyl/asparaginy/proline hydroxylase domain-containing protein n=1 Tax=Timema bartmani TaxID=61472 RepID=A0A7R9HWL0_9NEOP|nr:unnamed protein product [Timema bartmani]